MNLDTGEALDTLAPACVEWCESIGSPAKTIYDVLSGPDPKVMRAIQDGIDRTNKNAASNAQKIQKWTILPRDFTVIGDELGKLIWMYLFLFLDYVNVHNLKVILNVKFEAL